MRGEGVVVWLLDVVHLAQPGVQGGVEGVDGMGCIGLGCSPALCGQRHSRWARVRGTLMPSSSSQSTTTCQPTSCQRWTEQPFSWSDFEKATRAWHFSLEYFGAGQTSGGEGDAHCWMEIVALCHVVPWWRRSRRSPSQSSASLISKL